MFKAKKNNRLQNITFNSPVQIFYNNTKFKKNKKPRRMSKKEIEQEQKI